MKDKEKQETLEEKAKTPNHFRNRISHLGYASRNDKEQDSIRRSSIRILSDLFKLKDEDLRNEFYYRLLGRIRRITDYPKMTELRKELEGLYNHKNRCIKKEYN